MPIVVHCYYRPGGAEERLYIRDVHLEYVMQNQDLIQFGGAITEKAKVVGMYMMFRTDDEARVNAFLKDEPYGCARLFERVDRATVSEFIPEPRENFLDDLLVESRRVARELNQGIT
jgi:hypothetical protein